MDTLSKVSEYFNNLEDFLDDGDSSKARKIKVERSEKELEMFEALGQKSVVIETKKQRVVVFTKARPRAFSKPFMRFSMPCGVDGQGAWDAELDMADSRNYMTEEMFDKLGFVRAGYANEGEPLVFFGRDFLVTTKNKVDFGVGEMQIDLTMLEKERDIDALLECHVGLKKAQGKGYFALILLSKEAQAVSITDCQAGNPCELISDPTVESEYSMIRGIKGQ
ncbi:hypothetical protein Tco_0958647 [Tanacetum coccineum]